jgi:hypothetical protein
MLWQPKANSPISLISVIHLREYGITERAGLFEIRHALGLRQHRVERREPGPDQGRGTAVAAIYFARSSSVAIRPS